jgi:glycosyl hydrolase family 39 (putative alpha-L-iduronidase)
VRAGRHARRLALAGSVLAAAGAGALIAPATGSAAVAAIQDDVLATAPVSKIPARIALVQATRAKVTRVDVLWQTVATARPVNPADPADPAYDWTRADAIFTALDQAGITTIVSVYGTPDFAVAAPRQVRHPDTFYNNNAPRPADFSAFMAAISTRYSGTFTPPGASAPLPRIRHWEIWNEPNLLGFLTASNNARRSLPTYKAMLKAAYPKIKAANPSAIVIAGVGGPRSSGGRDGTGARDWVRGVTSDRSLKYDAFSQHIYPSQGPLFTSPRYRKAFPTWLSLPELFKMVDKKKKGMKIYITEAGYTTRRTPWRNVKVSLPQQRAYMRQMFALPGLRNPRVAAVVWFNLQDNAAWPGGLLLQNGKKKPSYATFVSIARRAIPAALRGELAR